MRRYANEARWNQLYISLDKQAKNNEEIIFHQIPENVPKEEINKVIQELRSLYNFKEYSIIKSENNNIKGVRKNV